MEAGVGVGSSSLAYIGSLILGKEKSLLRVGCAVLKQGLLNPEPPPPLNITTLLQNLTWRAHLGHLHVRVNEFQTRVALRSRSKGGKAQGGKCIDSLPSFAPVKASSWYSGSTGLQGSALLPFRPGDSSVT